MQDNFLHFWRCKSCLNVFTTFGKYRELRCGCSPDQDYGCEYLGKVEDTTSFNLEDACPCDSRCTGAQGPKCDCSCGGINHGKGLTAIPHMITEHILGDEVAVVDPPDNKKSQQYKEYLALVARVKSLYPVPTHWEKFIKWSYLDSKDWRECDKYSKFLRQIDNTKHLKTHAARIKCLMAIKLSYDLVER